jgi:hypothetical protein
MSHAGCRSSGLITADTLVNTGQCKLISFHGYNNHATDACTIKIYDNTAASNPQIAEIYLPGKMTTVMDDTSGGDQDAMDATAVNFECDFHAILCRNGIYVDVTGGTPRIFVEFA